MTAIVWLASYPKSGNTWVRLFLAALTRNRDIDLVGMDGASTIASNRNLLERFLDISLAEVSPGQAADLRPLAYRAMARTVTAERFFIKVHDKYGTTPSGEPLFPPEASRGCVHLIRDPRDVCLSVAAHDGVSPERAIVRMADSDAATGKHRRSGSMQVAEHRGSWSDHGESWLAAPMPRLTVRYEDMVANPGAALGAIAHFCGVPASAAALATAVERTTFSHLAAQEAETGFRERPDDMERFFRAGRSEQWRETLTAQQVERIERAHGPLMQRLGYTLVSKEQR